MERSSLRIFEPPDMDGVALVEARGIRQRLSRHAHARLVIGMVTDGWRELALPQGTRRVQPGELFVLRPGVPHACSGGGESGQGYRVLVLPAERAAAIRRTGHAACDATELRRRFERATRAIREGADLAEREALLGALAAAFTPSGTEPGCAAIASGNGKAAEIRRFLDSHWEERIDLARLAEFAGQSPFHLHRCFAAETGMTPAEYLARVRVRHAARLLCGGEPAAQVAAVCGFADQSHFIRVFKRLVGVSPGRYLDENRTGGLP